MLYGFSFSATTRACRQARRSAAPAPPSVQRWGASGNGSPEARGRCRTCSSPFSVSGGSNGRAAVFTHSGSICNNKHSVSASVRGRSACASATAGGAAHLVGALAVAHHHKVLPLPASPAVVAVVGWLWVHFCNLLLDPQLLQLVADALAAWSGRRVGQCCLPAAPHWSM